MAAYLAAYGDQPAFDVAGEVAAVMGRTRNRMGELAAAGVEPQRTWVAEGALVVTTGDSSGVPRPGRAPRFVAVARGTTKYGVAPAPCDARTRSTGHHRRISGGNH